VCECEGWEPVDNVDMSEERVPKTDKSIHEPIGWVKIDEVRQYFDSVNCGTIYKTAGEGRVPLYTAPYTKLDTTAGVLHKEWVGLTEEDFYKKDDETVFVLGMKFAEARLKGEEHMNNWFVGFAMGLLTLLAYEKLQEDPPPDVDIPITANDIVEAYKAGKRDALRTNVPSMELEQACVTLWAQKQPEEPK
jgi:hypothetical protein